MAPRLQGLFGADGALEIALWGAGDLGRLLVAPPGGPFVYAPNHLTWPRGGLFVAQSAPVLVLRGARFRALTPARRAAPWSPPSHTRAIRAGERRSIDLPWGCLIVEARGGDLVVAAGEDRREAERGLRLSTQAIVAEAGAHAATCDRLPKADPMLRSLVIQGVHAGLSSVRRDAAGGFAGLAAGLAYSAPARSYYRDGYWTLQLLLQLAPQVAGEAIELMACGVHPDGETPSGVIVAGPAQSAAWEERRLADPRIAAAHTCAGDWWSDHFDSPLLFILALGDHAAATGETGLVASHWPLVRAIFQRYRKLSKDGLPIKPRHDRDWADNVFRSGLVSYDLGLWVGALDVIARLGAHDPQLVAAAREAAKEARAAIDRRLWLGRWYADYVADDGFTESHLTLDALTLLRFGAAPNEKATAMLDAVGESLETRRNPRQPYGDWGVMCAFPPFARRADLRAKSAFPYRYHNGGDWPWLDGLYAAERLRRGLPGWRYPLTRWWEQCLARGWPAAVEYLSPPYGRGSPLQGWSSLPAATALTHSKAVLAGDPEMRG
ncbi:MAG TPA: GH116 family glycosyl hydrolase [Caulobacteraceae bacterium]|jgi:hypothetical protein|nr:GH116 family glycosyl hydrolase [Caulobacteraceae bacterium]